MDKGWSASTEESARMLPALLINGFFLIYSFTPGVKLAFGRS